MYCKLHCRKNIEAFVCLYINNMLTRKDDVTLWPMMDAITIYIKESNSY